MSCHIFVQHVGVEHLSLFLADVSQSFQCNALLKLDARYRRRSCYESDEIQAIPAALKLVDKELSWILRPECK